MEFDASGGIWGYGTTDCELIHYSYSLTKIVTLAYSDSRDFVYDISVDLDGTNIWFTDEDNNHLYYVDSYGATIQNITLGEPRALCVTSDGCWVGENEGPQARRYNREGTLIKTISMPREILRMSPDFEDGFWYISGDYLYRVDVNGNHLLETFVNAPTRVRGGHSGCIVYSSSNDNVKYFDGGGNLIRTFTLGTSNTSIPALMSFNYNDFQDFRPTGILPASYDPVWTDENDPSYVGWREVQKDGYDLPRVRYHQIEVTLQTDNLSSGPILNKITVPQAVKVSGIKPQISKPVYIRSNVPNNITIGDYTAKLKTWWYVDED
jgi:hypothetical protein